MKSFMGEALDAYVEAHARARSPIFDELRKITFDSVKYPQMQIGRVEGAMMSILVKLSGAKRAFEIGTFTGYSALTVAEAMGPGGKVVTCDIDPVATAVAKDFFARSGFGDRIELRMGDALETIKKLEPDDMFDFVFIDADKARYLDYYEAIFPHLVPGALILGDNTMWSGAVLDPKSPDDFGITRFNDHVTADPRVENVLLPVRDGVMLIRKK